MKRLFECFRKDKKNRRKIKNIGKYVKRYTFYRQILSFYRIRQNMPVWKTQKGEMRFPYIKGNAFRLFVFCSLFRCGTAPVLAPGIPVPFLLLTKEMHLRFTSSVFICFYFRTCRRLFTPAAALVLSDSVTFPAV